MQEDHNDVNTVGEEAQQSGKWRRGVLTNVENDASVPMKPRSDETQVCKKWNVGEVRMIVCTLTLK